MVEAAPSCLLVLGELAVDVVFPLLDAVGLCALGSTCGALRGRVGSAEATWRRETRRVFFGGEEDLDAAGSAMARHADLALWRAAFATRVEVRGIALETLLGDDGVDALVVPGVRQLRPTWGGALGALFDIADPSLGTRVDRALADKPNASLRFSQCLAVPGDHGLSPRLKGLVFVAGPHALLPDVDALLRRAYRNAFLKALAELRPPTDRPFVVGCVPISTGGNRVLPALSALVAMRQARALLRSSHLDHNAKLLFVSNDASVVRAFACAKTALLDRFGATDRRRRLPDSQGGGRPSSPSSSSSSSRLVLHDTPPRR